MTKKLGMLIFASMSLFALVSIFRLENIGTTALWNPSRSATWLLPLICVVALIDSINPCLRRDRSILAIAGVAWASFGVCRPWPAPLMKNTSRAQGT